MRIRFYLEDFDHILWKDFPCRINVGDFFYLDSFITEEDEETFKEDVLDDIYNGDSSIMYCREIGFNCDEDGIFQQVYLTQKQNKNERI